ncbi:type II secretion system protein E (plasmid) [Rhodoferax ferrireducens T118]|uniref:Type II secretion system protein E n=1 Tax=Albidiferax ferrireducens (strain ATCC BAA-621 / DSM 15236 / T118) TaxID=338969 RepID=Q21QJ5_ALBFT|nr:ATPase, T2SS/T4P/T4SS family [Rhodoferax ferrireducens]ABD71950.1 type II secretion system protein E [Rhodoferax ferrireducens T118]
MATVQIDATAKNAEKAFDLIRARLSPLFELFLQDGVTEVNFNGPDDAWVTRVGRREPASVNGINEVTASSAVRELASSMGQESIASTTSAIVDAKMPGFRFSAILSPIASKGTALSIRKHSPRVLSLQDYVDQKVISPEMARILSEKVKAGANMLIGGGTDSGKTTFLNALSREIPEGDRVGTIEDTRELSLIVKNWLPLETNAQKGVTATLCLKSLMRHSIDRIICGELRDGAAADFISSANTGHHGCMTTLHCNSAGMALERLEDLCLQGDASWPLVAIRRNIGRTIQFVAHFKKADGRRFITELIEIEGIDPNTNAYVIKSIFNHQEH